MSLHSPLPEACICCGSSQWRSRFNLLEQCEACGFSRAKLKVDPEDLRQLYAESYFCGDEYADYLADDQVHRKNFEFRLKQLLKIHDQPQSVFEIGCAYGFFLKACQQAGIPVRGVDISETPVEYAKNHGLDATCGDFLQLDLLPGSIDCFCMWDVIEHLPNPEKFVQRIFELLPPGGSLLLTTGDIESRNAIRRGKKWRMIHPPTHIQYFGHNTIERFLTSKGFETPQIQTVSMYRNAHSVLSALAVFNQRWLGTFAGGLHRLIPRGLQRLVGGWVDLGDIMLVSAKKPANLKC